VNRGKDLTAEPHKRHGLFLATPDPLGVLSGLALDTDQVH